MKRAFLLAVVVGGSLHAIVRAQSTVSVGRNNNLNPGILDEFVGDPFLQRQVEFKGACSALNPQHCVFGANDYRTVNFQSDTGVAEGLTSNGSAMPPPDAWIGLYRCYNGPEGHCANGLLPGSPFDGTALGLTQPWKGLAAASDVAIAADLSGYFPSAALVFNRGGTSQVVFWVLRDFNDDSRQPIRWPTDPTTGQPIQGRVLDQGAATATGQFADLPSVAVDVNGDWHVAWTVFANANSGIWYTVSHDKGQTFEGKVKISNPFNSVQRVVMDVGKGPSDAGTVYAIFRTFNPDAIAFTKKPFGSKAWTAPVLITDQSAPAGLCLYDQPTRDVSVGDPNLETGRARAFGTLQALTNGKLVVGWTERTDASGNPARGAACTTSALPLINVTYSDDQGATWKPRTAIDPAPRCEAATPNNPDGPVEKPCSASNVGQPRPAGPQMQPILKATPHLFLSYREGRGGLTQGFHSGRDAQMDTRVARLGFDANGIKLLATTQVSQYAVSVATGDIKNVDGAPGFKAYNRPYLPQYKGGTAAFFGDHDDFVTGDAFVFESPARWATTADVPAAKGWPVWGGDNREAGFPGGNLLNTLGWTQYGPAGTGAVSCINPTIKNSNGYTAYAGDPLDGFAPQPFKQLGGAFSGGASWASAKKRTWPIVIRNRTDFTRQFTATVVANTGAGFKASWDEFNEVPVLGNKPSSNPTCGSPSESYPACTSVRVLLPRSSMTLTVFGTGPADPIGSPIKVLLDDLSTVGNPDVIVRLNPNPNNPPSASSLGDKELHGAAISGPFPQPTKSAPWKGTSGAANPGPGNPGPGNPGPGNPGPGNNALINPGPGNPGPGNTGFTDYTDVQFFVKTEDLTNTISAYSTFVNIANPDAVDQSHLVQMIISRTLTSPAAANCNLIENNVDEILSTIPVPGPGNPGPGNPGPGNPGPGNPGPGNPGPGNPGPGNPGPGNNTFSLAPANAPAVGTSASATFRVTALASATGALVPVQNMDLAPDGTLTADPPPYQVQVTIRYWHCTVSGQCGSRPDGTPFTAEDPNVPGTSQDPAVRDSTVGGNTSATVVAEANNTNVLNDSYVVDENQVLNVPAANGVLANDIPGHGGTLSASLFGGGGGQGFGPFNGTVVMISDGSFVYTPNLIFNGSDTFIYQVTESAGTASSPSTALARVVITVNHVNQAPVANPDNVTVEAGSSANSIPVLANDTDVEGDQLTVFGVTNPTHGAASFTSSNVIYTPGSTPTVFVGSDSFKYTVCDNGTTHGLPDSKCATGMVNVTVKDTTPPVIAAHADVTAEATSGAGAPVSYPSPATSDAVDGAGVANCLPASGSQFALGNTTVTCNATDAHGNIAIPTSFVVHVVDTTAPVIAAHADVTAEATSAAGATVSYTSPATSDAVDGAGFATCLPASGSLFAFGNTTVTCNAKDAHDNPATPTTFVVHVVDTTPPVVTVPANQTLEATSASGATTTFVASATDIVDGTDLVTCMPASGSAFAITTTTVTCSATDAHGNTGSKTFTVTVRDTTPPVVTVPANQTLEATSASGAPATFAASATDIVDGTDPVTCVPASGSTFAIGTTTVNCSAMDAHGNKATGSFTVTVVDKTPPVVTVPANITAEATGAIGAAVTFSASASDVVDGAVATTCTPASGSTFGLTTTTVTCSATDAHGNTGSGSFTVKVVDATPPALTLPANITTVATSLSGATVTYSASAKDLVDGAVPIACAPPSGSAFPIGTTSVSCSATDAHGNKATGGFTITVQLRYGFIGVQNLPPPAGKTFNSGSSVPLKWQFTVGGVAVDSTNANPKITIVGPVTQTFTPGAPGKSTFQLPTLANGWTWQFNWQTVDNVTGVALPAGTYSVSITSQLTGQTFPGGQIQLK
jgi:hypothetical protein